MNAKTLKRSSNWLAEEEIVLVEEVARRENVLFGKMKGDGALKVGELKSRAWQEIADVLNARFLSKKREVQEIKKKYYNIKQRSKEKLDQSKRPQTGGGPANIFSRAESTYLDLNEGRPNVSGLTCGIDSDDLLTQEDYALVQQTDDTPVETVQLGVPESESDPVIDDDISLQATGSTCKRNRESKGQRRKLAELEIENLQLDNKRIKEEILKIKQEREVLALKKEILSLQKSKLVSELSLQYPVISLFNEN